MPGVGCADAVQARRRSWFRCGPRATGPSRYVRPARKGRRLGAARELLEELSSLQERLYAEEKSVLLVLQGLDASGKDGTIRQVFTGRQSAGLPRHVVQGPHSASSSRTTSSGGSTRAPARGMIGIFNRSQYEDVVTVGVLGLAPEEVWRRRPQRIVEFEQLLTEEGTAVLKCFLHVSAEEQRKRFAERLSDPTKRWKYNPKDEETSRRFGEFMAAYEEALTATSTSGRRGTSFRPTATGCGTSLSRPCSSRRCGGSTRSFPLPRRAARPAPRPAAPSRAARARAQDPRTGASSRTRRRRSPTTRPRHRGSSRSARRSHAG